MELLVLFIIVYACKHAITDTKGAVAKSRQAYMASADKRFPDMPAGKRAGHAARHDLGWFLSQLGHGFPATRNGFMTGWHESRQAHHQAMLGRQEAKTRNLEVRAGAVGQLQDYRARQQSALEQIRSGKAPSTPAADVPDACPDCGAPSGLTHLASCRYAGGREGTPEGTSPRQFPVMLTATSKSGRQLNPFTGEPTDWAIVRDEEDLQHRLAAVEQDPDIGVRVDPLPTEDEAEQPEAEGNPTGTTVTEDHWDDPLPGEEGSPSPEEGTPEGTSSSTPETSPTSTASTEGTTMAGSGDTSYNEIDQGLTQDHDTAETLAAEQQQAAAQQEEAANAARSALARTNAMIDAAGALKLDPATSSELMEHAEAQKTAAEMSDAAHEAHLAALEAHQRVMETSQAGQTTLRTNHGQYQQAHDDSPVDSADSEFYAA